MRSFRARLGPRPLRTRAGASRACRVLVGLCLITAVLAAGEPATAPPAAAAAAPPMPPAEAQGARVEMSAKPTQLAVGDQVEVAIVLRWPASWKQPFEPDPAAGLAGAFVTALPPAQVARTGEEERRTWRVRLLAERSGPWALPRPRFVLIAPQGTVEIAAPEVLVQVGAEAAAASLPAARPLWTRPPPAAAQSGLRGWQLAAIAGAAALALATLIWLALRRRRGPPPRPPLDELEDELARALGAADGKEAGARLHLAVRRYAGARWSFDGAGATTRETLAALRPHLQGDELSAAGRILGDLDDLRWGPSQLGAAAVAPLADAARGWARSVESRLRAEAEAARAQREGRTAATGGRA